MALTLEYLAGFFDADGSLGVYKSWSSGHPQQRKKPRNESRPRRFEYFLSVTVRGNYEYPIRAYAQRFGGSVRYVVMTKGRRDGHPTHWWTWSARGTAALLALESMAPYLTVKHAQAVLALSMPRSTSGRHLTPAQREKRREIGERLKTLKQGHLL